MNTKKHVVSAALAAAVGVNLLCGFGFAKKEYVYQQFETAEPVTSVTVQDASANVIIQAADTDHITVRYGTLPGEDPLYDISVQDGRLVVEARDDVDVDTTDDGLALVRVRIEGHNIDPWSGRELTITLPDKSYEQLDATLAVGSLKVEGVDAKNFSAVAAAGEAEVSDVQAEQLELASAAGKVILRDAQVQKAEVAAAAGSAVVENVEADALSVSGAVGGSSLKQVTAGDLEIASALGSIKLEDVWADNYIKAGLILHTSGRIQKR